MSEATANTIECPSDGHSYSIKAAHSKRYEERLRDELHRERNRLSDALLQPEDPMQQREQALEGTRKRENEPFKQRIEREKVVMKSQVN